MRKTGRERKGEKKKETDKGSGRERNNGRVKDRRTEARKERIRSKKAL